MRDGAPEVLQDCNKSVGIVWTENLRQLKNIDSNKGKGRSHVSLLLSSLLNNQFQFYSNTIQLINSFVNGTILTHIIVLKLVYV